MTAASHPPHVPPHVIDVTQANYEQQVIEASRRVPVLVDFWADWCGPCKMQLPVLLKLVEAYAGGFILAKINTDQERGLANAHKIRSIPTMKLIRNGEVVEEILGAQTESTLRSLLDKHVARASDSKLEQAQQMIAGGDTAGALELLRTAVAEDPNNPRIQLDYLRTAMGAGQIDEAEQILQAMPVDIREDSEVRRHAALLTFAKRIQGQPAEAELLQRIDSNADDLAARELLAARLALRGDAENALEQFFEIMRRDRKYGDDAGRKGMLALFELLGNGGPLVNRYRSQMFNLLH